MLSLWIGARLAPLFDASKHLPALVRTHKLLGALAEHPFEAPLLDVKRRTGGRNTYGRVTTRHHGGGHKRRYRIIDLKRDKDGIPAVVERLEYDPNRSAHLALLRYADGERRYIIAPKGVHAGDTLMSGPESPIRAGNAMPLRNIPLGSTVHCIEMKPGKGAQIARSAGAAVQIAAREGHYATLRLRSGEMRRIHVDCRATIGEVGNEEHNLRKFGKAGAVRWRSSLAGDASVQVFGR